MKTNQETARFTSDARPFPMLDPVVGFDLDADADARGDRYRLAAMSPATIEAADHRARHWAGDDAGPIEIGSAAHKQLACRMFRETFNAYKPSIIEWPKLEPAARDRLVNLPIWDIAVQTEGKARQRMASYAQRLTDRDWHEAIEQNSWEEGRHKRVLSHLVETYAIELEPEPPYPEPKDAEWAYMVTGYSECIDSFFAFGLFELARRSNFFPMELVGTFEPVMQEEARHILLFANWVAWQRRDLSLFRRIFFECRVAAVWLFLGWERIGMARGLDDKDAEQGKPAALAQDNNFTVTGSKAVTDTDVKVTELMAICLEENDRRFAGYDQRLLRPQTMPTLVRWFLRVALWFQRRPRPSVQMGS